MRIIRFYDEDGTVHHGIQEGEKPVRARLIDGDIFSRPTITNRVVTVKRLLAPLAPTLIYAIGLNYRRHADETGASYPDRPVLFMKATTSVIGHGETILLPLAGPDEVDYEAELAIVIGKKGKNISAAEAEEYIFGYCCANDISARDWQLRKQKGQWVRAKSFDTFCPLGPAVVTRDEIDTPNDLRIRTLINGRSFQDSTTADMLFNVYEIVSDLSSSVTLLPGAVILTGTPEGVGFTRTPPVFLAPGDEVSIQIEGIGELTNPVAMESA
ncbi:MAG: fumarylacetoacetate hydrolase family protein [Syntrophales bacterium]|nr:fumarylacetoacetate hydrolase family protein [Syntrophales bacterium]